VATDQDLARAPASAHSSSGWRRLGRRAGWGIGDQAFSSLTNFAVGIMVARTQTPREFGAFSLAFATYVVALNVSRAVSTEPLVVRYSAAPAEQWARGTRSATGSAVATGTLAGLACIVAGIFLGGTLGSAFLALGLTMPGLLLQDSWRFAFFAKGKGRQAFLNDAMWALVLFPGLVLLSATGHHSVFALTLCWGGAATAAGLFGILQSRLAPQPMGSIAWLREQWDLAPRFLGEFMALSGTTQISFYFIGAIASLEVVGALRAAQILLGPVYAFSIGIRLVATPEVVRLSKRSTRRLRDATAALSAGLALATLLWGLALLFLPADLGISLIGSSWGPARSVLVPMTVLMATGGVIGGITAGLRALASAKRSLRARLVTSVTRVAGGVVGALTGGAVAAAWGLAISGCLGALVYGDQLARGLRESRAKTNRSGDAVAPETASQVRAPVTENMTLIQGEQSLAAPTDASRRG
jgi:O-antigen/teichoic acid export membrane protein